MSYDDDTRAWVDEIKTELTRLRAENEELRKELNATTEMYTDAWHRAISMWQEETGKDDIWPDTAKHYVYLMGKIDELIAECEEHCKIAIRLQENHDVEINQFKQQVERLQGLLIYTFAFTPSRDELDTEGRKIHDEITRELEDK